MAIEPEGAENTTERLTTAANLMSTSQVLGQAAAAEESKNKFVKAGVAAGTARSVKRTETGATEHPSRRKMWNSGTTTQNSILT